MNDRRGRAITRKVAERLLEMGWQVRTEVRTTEIGGREGGGRGCGRARLESERGGGEHRVQVFVLGTYRRGGVRDLPPLQGGGEGSVGQANVSCQSDSGATRELAPRCGLRSGCGEVEPQTDYQYACSDEVRQGAANRSGLDWAAELVGNGFPGLTVATEAEFRGGPRSRPPHGGRRAGSERSALRMLTGIVLPRPRRAKQRRNRGRAGRPSAEAVPQLRWRRG